MIDLIDRIIRSKRRTIALVITKNATLEVRAPFTTTIDVIEKFVTQKKSWIEKKKELVNKIRVSILPKTFIDGESFVYEGNTYKLQCGDYDIINISKNLYFPKKLLPEAKQHLTVWYKNRALQKITERVNHFSNITQLKYKSIKLSNAERSWGSCNSKGSLRINWRLIMAPPNILDYVIVHELIHLVERNHSKRFWKGVQVILPNYKEQKNWLKHNSNTLTI